MRKKAGEGPRPEARRVGITVAELAEALLWVWAEALCLETQLRPVAAADVTLRAGGRKAQAPGPRVGFGDSGRGRQRRR